MSCVTKPHPTTDAKKFKVALKPKHQPTEPTTPTIQTQKEVPSSSTTTTKDPITMQPFKKRKMTIEQPITIIPQATTTEQQQQQQQQQQQPMNTTTTTVQTSAAHPKASVAQVRTDPGKDAQDITKPKILLDPPEQKKQPLEPIAPKLVSCKEQPPSKEPPQQPLEDLPKESVDTAHSNPQVKSVVQQQQHVSTKSLSSAVVQTEQTLLSQKEVSMDYSTETRLTNKRKRRRVMESSSSDSDNHHSRKHEDSQVSTRQKKRDEKADDASMISFKPIREYYHPGSYQQLDGRDWYLDSDEESNESWRVELDTALLDDFTDVSEPEKVFFRLWNAYVRSNTCTPAKTIPKKCHSFIAQHAHRLEQNGLEQALIGHLTNLWDEGLISRDHLLEFMQHYRNCLLKS